MLKGQGLLSKESELRSLVLKRSHLNGSQPSVVKSERQKCFLVLGKSYPILTRTSSDSNLACLIGLEPGKKVFFYKSVESDLELSVLKINELKSHNPYTRIQKQQKRATMSPCFCDTPTLALVFKTNYAAKTALSHNYAAKLLNCIRLQFHYITIDTAVVRAMLVQMLSKVIIGTANVCMILNCGHCDFEYGK
ncbi:hypothetical protein VNO80_19996 [Phaseolus coccineus]|uniref:Uncharacterized protein n=1 Tax=Phaseolus coccineus TaxID=3886 RepID=A0AAN9R0S8_PHACN